MINFGIWAFDVSRSFNVTGHTTVARVGHTATLLDDGSVLIVGGRNLLGVPLASCEIYEPANRTFVAAATMSVARDNHTATLLPGGDVLIAGGETLGGKILKSTEVYDLHGHRFVPGPAMSDPRVNHTANLLRDGALLIAGGIGADDKPLRQANIFDFRSQTFISVSDMSTPRANHTATTLANGKVLIVGGENLGPKGAPALPPREAAQTPELQSPPGSELFDFATRSFTPCAGQLFDRNFHTTTMLPNGSVLIAGSVSVSGGVLREAYLYDPATESFRPTAAGMIHARANHAATFVANGNVLLSGGFSKGGLLRSTEEYDSGVDRFTYVGDMHIERNFHTATILMNGHVLIVGGEDARGRAIDIAEVYEA